MRTSMPILAVAAGSLWVGACARQQQPVVLPPATIPVRVDSSGAMVVGGAGRHVPTAADDPFFRIDRMDWPGPNQYRDAAGSPGPAYWQQRADYTIAATLDTAAQRVSGRVTIRYTNNSPDSLPFVWLQLDQNLYRPGSLGAAINPADSRWGARNFAGGYTLQNVAANGKPARYKVDDTMMRLDLDAPIAPKGGKATFAMEFSFNVPEHGSDRMGRDGTLYEIAQWYPRMAVYDDVRGWNTDPYLGQGEFYLEYGSYDYSVTAPAGYVIAGSGVLQNPNEVLTAEQRSRLAQAAKSQQVVQVITAAESAPSPVAGTKTWRFHADSVHDVAWAGAPDFRWDATSWNGILTQAYYSWPRAGKGWENAAENTQWTIRTYSQLIYPYPYPQATSVAGPVGGMEYPMFVMVHYAPAEQGAFGTIDHEHGHEWFPMIVGSNERRYAWMDEGFNTYLNAFSNERRTTGYSAWPEYMANWRQIVERGIQSPLMTPPDRIDRAALGAIGYRKPGAVLLALRNHVVGRETFDLAFREYVRRWAFKHPTPADFFRTVENFSGQDLSWFWRGFMYSEDVLDIGVDDVTMATSEGEQIARVTLRQLTSIPFPVEMRLKLADGTTTDVKLPVQIWSRGDVYTAEIPVKGRVVGARLWPDPSVPDWNAKNDTWGDAPPAEKLGPVTMGGYGASSGEELKP
ncbi:MAG TPA: M1 family metallopeptidase [Gemmatimonadaceae bacterium]|nr:M1 family metallopeptidase [Gemmatimonadaceae bacterium]